MIKALLIVSALGGVDYEVEMPSMESCLTARTSIAEQNTRIETLCVPKEDEAKRLGSFFNLFEDMVIRMQDMEGREDDKLRSDGYKQTNRECS